LERQRRDAIGVLQELKQRWASVTHRLRQNQDPRLATVAAKRDLGLLGLLVLLLAWPDTTFPLGSQVSQQSASRPIVVYM